MPRMLDVSDDVRAEIGDEEADRLLAGEQRPGQLRLHLLPHPGRLRPGAHQHRALRRRGDRRARLRPRHLHPLPGRPGLRGAAPGRRAVHHRRDAEPPRRTCRRHRREQAVLGITSGLVLIEGELRPALVVEPTAPDRPPRRRPGRRRLPPAAHGAGLPADRRPEPAAAPVLPGWSVLLAMGQLHAVLQPGAAAAAARSPGGRRTSRSHVTDGWRAAANKSHTVLVYAAPVGSIGQPAPRGPVAGRAGPGRGEAARWSPRPCRWPAPDRLGRRPQPLISVSGLPSCARRRNHYAPCRIPRAA